MDETDPSYDDPTMEDCGYEILSKVRPVPAKPAAAAALAAAPTTATAAAATSGILYVCVHAAWLHSAIQLKSWFFLFSVFL